MERRSVGAHQGVVTPVLKLVVKPILLAIQFEILSGASLEGHTGNLDVSPLMTQFVVKLVFELHPNVPTEIFVEFYWLHEFSSRELSRDDSGVEHHIEIRKVPGAKVSGIEVF